MVENPKVGMQCWIITDLWETVCPIPVEIIAEDAEGGVFLCRWKITEEYHEDYEEIWPEWMFATDKAAWEQIRIERRLEECREKQEKKRFI